VGKTRIGKKTGAKGGGGSKTLWPAQISQVPPPNAPVPAPFAAKTSGANAIDPKDTLKRGGTPMMTKGTKMSTDPPLNQPALPIADAVTHAKQAKAKVASGSSKTKASGDGVAATTDSTKINTLTGNEEVAQGASVIVEGAGASAGGPSKKKKAAKKKKKKAPKKPPQGAKQEGDESGTAKGAPATDDPIVLATGDVISTHVDLVLPGIWPLQWQRFYSSDRDYEHGQLGAAGWTHPFEQWVAPDGDVITLRKDDGSQVHFARIEPGQSTFHRRARLTLSRDAHGGYRVRDAGSRRTRRFAPQVAGSAVAQLTAIEDDWGNSVQLVYEAGRLVRILDTAGRTLHLLLDAKSRIHRLEARVGESEALAWVDYEYHPEGELAVVRDAAGGEFRYDYDGYSRLVQTTYPNGFRYRHVWDDETNRCIHGEGDGGVMAVDLHFDEETGATVLGGTDEARSYLFNDQDQIIREETPDGMYLRERSYDEDGYLLEEKNAAGTIGRFQYDARGNQVATADASGNIQSWTFDEDDLLRVFKSADGLETHYQWDARGGLAEVTYPTGAIFRLTRDGRGRLTALHGPDGLIAAIEYDAQGNRLAETDARGAVTRYTYDALGRPLTRTDALGRVSAAQYDVLGRPVAITSPDGTQTRATYDAMGNVTSYEDERGRSTRMTYGGSGVLKRLEQADGQVWELSYDADERLVEIKNPRCERYEFTYDRLGRVTTERTFDARVLEYRYSTAERLSHVDYPDGTFRDFLYDPLGNIVEDRSPDGSIKFQRDKLGRLSTATMRDPMGTVVTTLERDALGRVVVETQGERVLKYQYDRLGRRLQRSLALGDDHAPSITDYGFDEAGALSSVTHDGYRLALSRDVLGRETTRLGSRGGFSLQSQYDARDRLIEQRASAPSPEGFESARALVDRKYRYDASGRVGAIEDARWGTAIYEHDPIGQLLSVTRGAHREVFEYDVAGSLTKALSSLDTRPGSEEAWAVAPGNRLERQGDTYYEYDRRSRRVAKIESGDLASTERRTQYGWDARDWLREVVLPDGQHVRFAYDAFGRRVRKEVIAAEARDFPAMLKLAVEKGKEALPPKRVVEFVWDGNALAAEISKERGARVFVHAPSSVTPLLQAEQGGIFACVTDHLGMVKELVDEDGRVAWAGSFSAWGTLLEERRDERARRVVSSPFRLVGQYYDAETGLGCTRFRYFEAEVGRWISPDPIGLAGGLNVFAFDGSPVLVIDPLGLCEHNQTAKDRLAAAPETPGVYHLELIVNGEKFMYTGQAVDIRARLSKPNHPARALLEDPNTTVTVKEVTFPADLDTSNQRDVRRTLGVVEQNTMIAKDNIDQATARRAKVPTDSLNKIPALTPKKLKQYGTDYPSTVGPEREI
jgi:RHS repeat-associated protein